MSLIRTFLKVALVSALPGCASVYVETQAATYSSLSYSPNMGASASSGAVISGSSYGVGIAAGVAFDNSRKHRFALGYQSIATHVGGGGKTAGGSSDARLDLKLMELGESVRVRLALGFGFGTADSTGYKDGTGTVLAAQNGTNAGALYAGPAISRYFGGHHELTAMVGAQYYFAGVPGGSIGGIGGVAKLTYTFHIANSWPDVDFDMSVATAQNLMPIIQTAAGQAGCAGSTFVFDHNTAAVASVKCPGKGDIFFAQTTDHLGGFCSKMSRATCHALVHEIDDRAAALLRAAEPAPAATPPAPPPAAAPSATDPAAPTVPTVPAAPDGAAPPSAPTAPSPS